MECHGMSHFSFGFDVEEEHDGDGEQVFDTSTAGERRGSPTGAGGGNEPFSEMPLARLLDSLPSLISFSPFGIPLSSGRKLTFHRRDLFDARFQLISEEDDRSEGLSALDFVDNPSDLVPGVYEGGLKTWECSLDMVDYLEGTNIDVRGRRVLELGCGTAIPSLYLLHEIFASESLEGGAKTVTEFHFQDYNASVLELVTMPNVLLIWYMSPASMYRTLNESSTEGDAPTELSITPALIEAFLGSLEALGISLRFFAGSWANFDLERCGGKRYDVVMTSETIYRTESLDSLISVMQACCGFTGGRNGGALTVELDGETSIEKTASGPTPPPYTCLVAAKLVYFGVGGGVAEFVRAIEASPSGIGCKGNAETVWERQMGVGRRIMRIMWPGEAQP